MKETFQKGMPEGYTQTYPVTAENFPPTIEEGCSVVSPRIGKPHGLKPPLKQGDEGFEEMVAETLEVRQQTVAGVWPAEFLAKYGADPIPPAPLRKHVGRTPNPKLAADLVHMDDPDDLGRILIDFYGLKLKEKPKHVEFVKGRVLGLEHLITDIRFALDQAFEAKWFFGASRPEERLPLGADWTHYEEGSPKHPRKPAGHGRAAGATADHILDNYETTAEQEEGILQSCMHFAQYRTFSGMHDAEDNLAGLALSPRMAARFPAVKAQLA